MESPPPPPTRSTVFPSPRPAEPRAKSPPPKSHRSSRRSSRRPSPLKIKSAQVPGHIHHLANKKQPAHLARFHRLAGKLIGIHPARRHFGLTVTLGISWNHNPFMQSTFKLLQLLLTPSFSCALCSWH